MPRGNGGGHHLQTWPIETRAEEVLSWASKQLPDALVLFAAAMQASDPEQALVHVKRLRNVVTRMDQFRRMKVRQWSARQTSSAKS
jgi:hypothetical protein